MLFDQVIQPQRERNQPNTRYTGLTLEQITHAPPLAEVWQQFTRTLAARLSQRGLSARTGKHLLPCFLFAQVG